MQSFRIGTCQLDGSVVDEIEFKNDPDMIENSEFDKSDEPSKAGEVFNRGWCEIRRHRSASTDFLFIRLRYP